MCVRLSFTRTALEDFERDRLPAPLRASEAVTALCARQCARDFSDSCEICILDPANAGRRGRFTASLRRPMFTQGGAAR